MDSLYVPKSVMIVWPKITQMPKNLSAQFVYPSPKVLDFNEKRLYWVSVVRGEYEKLHTSSMYRECARKAQLKVN